MLNSHRNNNCIQTVATFIPDELIYEGDLPTSSFRNFTAVMATVSTTQLFNMHKKYASAENGGSHALLSLLNSYIKIIIEEVYFTHGDVLKFSRTYLLFVFRISR